MFEHKIGTYATMALRMVSNLQNRLIYLEQFRIYNLQIGFIYIDDTSTLQYMISYKFFKNIFDSEYNWITE